MIVKKPDELPEKMRRLIDARQEMHSLPQPFYTDSDFFQADLAKVFYKMWLYVGHVSRIPRAGDYFLYEIGGESIIIIRGEDDQVRALVNVCRHRGSRICLEAEGHVRNLVCPYHAWVYGTDGRLKTARLMPDEFDTSPYGLHAAAARVFEGMIFICLSDDPPDIEPMVRYLQPLLSTNDLARAKIAATRAYLAECNWKLIAENNAECYHCGPAHPEYCTVFPNDALSGNARAREKHRAYAQERRAHWEKIGLRSAEGDGEPDRCYHGGRRSLGNGFESMSVDGKPLVRKLMGHYPERDCGTIGLVIWPTMWTEWTSEFVMTQRLIPKTATTTIMQIDWYVHGDAALGSDYELDHLMHLWKATAEQDWKICSDNQAGVNSRWYRPGPYAPAAEGGPENFVKWYLKQVSE